MTQTVGNSSLETANQLLQQGKIQEAVAEYRRGIELTPDLSWHHYYLGEALTQLEDWEGAAQAYRQAIALGSNYLCYYRLGVALVKLELWDEAIEVLNRGLELKPDYYKFYLPLGQALVHQQHWEAAIEAYGKAVALKPGVAEFNLQLGHLLRRQGRFTEAVGYLQQAADFQGDDPQLQLGLGVALVEAGTDLHRAEASLRRTLELQPDQGEAYFYLGKLEGLRGRWDEALAMYRRSWEINPQVGEWGLALAEALEKLGRWSEAVDQYRQVVLELGESGEASLGLGRALVQLERPVEAVVELRRAVKLGVDRPEVHRLWAGVLVELGRWPEVVDQWKWLLERYPGAADVRRRLALALMGLGRWPEAAAQWGEYWRVAPGSGRGRVMDFRRELGTHGEIDHRQELSITGDLTVEFWLYLRQWPEGWTEIISKFVSDEQNEFCFRLKDGQRAQWYFGKGEAFAKPVDWVPQEDMRLHEWVHVACVRKVGEYGRIYFDGVLRREEDWSGEPEAAGTEAIVRLMAHSDGKRFNDGKLSEVRIWNRARSADEIRQGMYEALTGDKPGLVGVWHGSDDGVLVDAVGHHDGRSVMADGGKERLRVGVCGWELSHNAAGRAYTLAQLYGGWAEVELIGCLFPRYGGQVWEPIRGAEIPCHTVTVADEGRFVEQALGLVLAHPYEVVHLSKPRIPNIVLGLLYKLVWGARVIVDIDDEELAFVKAEAAVDWRELPPLRDLDSQEWTEIAAGLAREFDKVRELNEAETGELLAAVVAEVLAVPGCGVSRGLGLLLQGLPPISILKKGAVSLEDALQGGTVKAILERSQEKIRQFHNKHLGQRCVIIGNGPSLNEMDLSFLKDEICFGTNKIYLGFERWQFSPTYYVAVNPFVIEQSIDEIRKISCPKFIGNRGISYFDSGDDMIFVKTFPPPAESFSKRADLGLNEGCTVTYVAMQLAYYMGFSEVVLIGVDHHFVTQGTPHKAIVSDGDDLNHFDPSYFGKGVKWQLPDLENSEKSYRVAKQVFEESGRKIIDATVNGRCQVFPKQDYRLIFKVSLPVKKSIISSNIVPNKVLAVNSKDDLTSTSFKDKLWKIKKTPDDLLPYYQALKNKPRSGYLYLQLANALAQKNQLNEAIILYKIVWKIEPNSKNALDAYSEYTKILSRL